MFYWNPLKPDTQFFFNDREAETGRVFTVLFDTESRRRIREYRFADHPIGNGGVMQGAGWTGNKKHPRINAAFVVNSDGTGLRRLNTFIGGHPERDYGHRMIGALDGRQIIYDVDRDQVVGQLASEDVFPNPGGDIALSPQGDWIVNGHKSREQAMNFYTFFQRSTGRHFRSRGFNIGPWLSGDLRQDPSPAWNRSGTRILVPAIVGGNTPGRQLFVVSLPTGD